jgi:hypothetical protein
MAKQTTANRNQSKKLRRGKKLEASRPLFVAVEHGATSNQSNGSSVNYLTYNLENVYISH